MPEIRHLLIEDLIGSKIVSADGRQVGHVVEVRVSPGPVHRILSLLYGRYGWLSRLHMHRSARNTLGLHVVPHEVPWEAVDRFERFTVWLKPDWDARRAPVPPEVEG